jgi:hypothetical protein
MQYSTGVLLFRSVSYVCTAALPPCLAAISTAEHVAGELGVALGSTVGYQAGSAQDGQHRSF